MTPLWLLALGPGCMSRPTPEKLAPAPATQPSVDLGSGGASVYRLLDHLAEAKLTVPDSSLPAGAHDPGVFVLDRGWTTAHTGKHDRQVWVHSCPVRLSQRRYTATPIGMRLVRGETELPYAPGLSVGIGEDDSWEVQDDTVVVASRQSPETWEQPPVLYHRPTATQEKRLNLTTSGLSTTEFVAMSVTLDDLTRSGLMLPAPGKAEFDLDIPMGATLRFGWGMATPPAMAGDAGARFSVAVDGQSLWSSPGTVDQNWQEARVDLSAYGGRKVHLTLATDPDGDPSWDYAVFATPEIVGAASGSGPRRVVVVGIDTLRQDHVGAQGYRRPTTPGLDGMAEQSIVFDSAWSPAPRTRPSFRTATTGRWPLPAITSPSIGELMASHGFSTGGAVANVHLSPRMGFAKGYGWWHYENSAVAADQVDRALEWLTAHADEDCFFFLHVMDPHLFYEPPRPFLNLFTGGLDQGAVGDEYNRWMVVREDKRHRISDENKAFMMARYDGEIAYTDWQLSRFFAALDKLPGKTLTVLHSDHGEEFWDHDSYEHNHTLYNELVHVLMWIRPPGGWGGGPHRVSQPVSLADIAPTLFDLVGLPEADRPPTDGTSLAAYVDPARGDQIQELSRRLSGRPLPVGYLMYDTERWAVIDGDTKYILHTVSGQEELYDLSRDPHEQNNLARVRMGELPHWRARLEEATGWPVRSGWRMDITNLTQPFDLRFDQPVLEAGVIDPEAARERRANLEWGERPPVLAADVATVSVGEDGHLVHIVPGSQPNGTLYVLGPEGDDPATIVSSEGEHPLQPSLRLVGGSRVRFRSGTIIVPRQSEADYLHLDFGSSDDDASIEALRELGYME